MCDASNYLRRALVGSASSCPKCPQRRLRSRLTLLFVSVCPTLALTSHVVDLGNLVVVGLLEVALRLDVALDLAQSFDLLDIAGDVLVLGEEFVVSQPLNEVEELDQVEVKIADLITEHVVLLAEELDDRRDLNNGVLGQRVFVRLDVAGARDVLLDFLQLGPVHVNHAVFCGVLTEELRGVRVGQVQHNSVDVGQLVISIDQVGHRREVESDRVLDRGPGLN